MWRLFLLGLVQGITEWLPISSEGVIVWLNLVLFNINDLESLVKLALWLHLGTWLAALIYFRRDIWQLTKALFRWPVAAAVERSQLIFLIATTIFTGLFLLVLSFFYQWLLADFISLANFTLINLVIGVALVLTSWRQFKSKANLVIKQEAVRSLVDLNLKDALWLGFWQSLAVIPGVSRSGMTVSGLLLRKFDDQVALKQSFLLSIPLVLGANLILNRDHFRLDLAWLVALGSAFVFGYLTIHLLLKVAAKINFAWFTLVFGLLLIVVSFVSNLI